MAFGEKFQNGKIILKIKKKGNENRKIRGRQG